VSQVHLRAFGDPALEGQLHAYRKPGGQSFICRTRDVCRDDDWSSNDYFTDPRVAEDYLRLIEPRYARAVQALRMGRPDDEAILAIAGFAAYVATLSPTGTRLLRAMHRASLVATARSLEAAGHIPPPPARLGAGSLSELLSTGAVTAAVDGHFVRAVGLQQLHALIMALGNGHWTVYRVGPGAGSLLTSDYPVACVTGGRAEIVARFVPLEPDLGVLMRPRPTAERPVGVDRLAFDRLTLRHATATADTVRAANRWVVQSAENMVFAHQRAAWLPRFVARHGSVWLETVVEHDRRANGAWQHASLQLRPRPTVGHVRPTRWE
jgi:hypothetical protein